MASYNKQKLVRIDEQILNLEYMYERELLREKELNKHTLLLSRGFRYRLDNLYRARQALVKTTGELNTKEMNYAITLAERKNALLDEQKELDKLYAMRDASAAKAHIFSSEFHAQEAVDYAHEIPKQEARVRNKKRALDNWIDKAGNIQTKERKLAANVDIEELASDVNNHIDDPKKKYEEYLSTLKEQSMLKIENNASIDMLTQPTQELVEENPFLLNEPKKKIVI